MQPLCKGFGKPIGDRPRELVAAMNDRPRRFTKTLLRQGFDYMLKRGEQGDLDMPPAFAIAPAEIRAAF